MRLPAPLDAAGLAPNFEASADGSSEGGDVLPGLDSETELVFRRGNVANSSFHVTSAIAGTWSEAYADQAVA